MVYVRHAQGLTFCKHSETVLVLTPTNVWIEKGSSIQSGRYNNFMVVVIMGVSGSGKSTLGELLASELGGRFFEADNYHPTDNINKMMRGEPLEDGDRAPWLTVLSGNITKWCKEDGVVVLACSALKHTYRAQLRGG